MIADVGFGDSFTLPVILDKPSVQQSDAEYRVISVKDKFILQQQKPAQIWQSQYQFSLTPYIISDFYSMCEFHQTSAQSTFTKKSVCSIATKNGRKTISTNQFIQTIYPEKPSAGSRSNKKTSDVNMNKIQKVQSLISQPEQYRQLLQEHFNLKLPSDISSKMWSKLGLKGGI